MTTARDRTSTASPFDRPAVVERVDSPQSTSDGRATIRSIGPQVLAFGLIGVVSTLAWAGLFSLLRGAGVGSVAANGLALVVTAVANTAANRRFTFGRTDRDGLARDHAVGFVAFLLGLAITTAAAALLGRFAPHAGRLVEITVLAGANVVATCVRFILLRTWVGGPRRLASATTR